VAARFHTTEVIQVERVDRRFYDILLFCRSRPGVAIVGKGEGLRIHSILRGTGDRDGSGKVRKGRSRIEYSKSNNKGRGQNWSGRERARERERDATRYFWGGGEGGWDTKSQMLRAICLSRLLALSPPTGRPATNHQPQPPNGATTDTTNSPSC
jgi:hypothetical protein